jgi:hypothetical protein
MVPFGSSALARPHVVNMKTTKKANGARKRVRRGNGLAREYRFDYAKSRPNRFAGEFSSDAVVVVLDADVAKVFTDPKRVNALLRATIAAVDKPRKRKAG